MSIVGYVLLVILVLFGACLIGGAMLSYDLREHSGVDVSKTWGE